MPAYRFPTAFGECEIRYESGCVTGFRLPSTDSAAVRAHADEPTPEFVPRLAERVQRHFNGQWQDFSDVAFAWEQVTAFQQSVYQATLRVPAGCTATYGAIADAIGEKPAVSRAVGVALGQNPWPLLVPCHRVVGANGKMTGFSGPGGIRTKLRLLALEGAQLLADA